MDGSAIFEHITIDPLFRFDLVVNHFTFFFRFFMGSNRGLKIFFPHFSDSPSANQFIEGGRGFSDAHTEQMGKIRERICKLIPILLIISIDFLRRERDYFHSGYLYGKKKGEPTSKSFEGEREKQISFEKDDENVKTSARTKDKRMWCVQKRNSVMSLVNQKCQFQ